MINSIELAHDLDELSRASHYGGTHSLGRTLYGVLSGHLFRHPGHFLEIGTNLGYSALWAAAAQADAYESRRVVSVDVAPHSRPKFMGRQPSFLTSRIDFRLIRPFTRSFDADAKRGAELVEDFSPYTAIFVDGDHTYEGVRADLLAYLPLASPHAILLAHDTHSPEIRRALVEYALGWRWHQLHAWGAIAVATRCDWDSEYKNV